jgi:hypothetical protein
MRITMKKLLEWGIKNGERKNFNSRW